MSIYCIACGDDCASGWSGSGLCPDCAWEAHHAAMEAAYYAAIAEAAGNKKTDGHGVIVY